MVVTAWWLKVQLILQLKIVTFDEFAQNILIASQPNKIFVYLNDGRNFELSLNLNRNTGSTEISCFFCWAVLLAYGNVQYRLEVLINSLSCVATLLNEYFVLQWNCFQCCLLCFYYREAAELEWQRTETCSLLLEAVISGDLHTFSCFSIAGWLLIERMKDEHESLHAALL